MDFMPDYYESLKTGDLDRVRDLFHKDPAMLQARSHEGISLVLLAIYYAEPEIAEFLIEQGAPLDIFDLAATGDTNGLQEKIALDPALVHAWSSDGYQPIGLASFFGQLEVVKLLLQHGAEVNQPSRNPMQVTPLHSAAAGQHLEIARLLLKHGAKPNARQSAGFTPLHSAAQNGQIGLIRILLRHDADPFAQTEAGDTPLTLALKAGQTAAARIFQQHAKERTM